MILNAQPLILDITLLCLPLQILDQLGGFIYLGHCQAIYLQIGSVLAAISSWSISFISSNQPKKVVSDSEPPLSTFLVFIWLIEPASPEEVISDWADRSWQSGWNSTHEAYVLAHLVLVSIKLSPLPFENEIVKLLFNPINRIRPVLNLKQLRAITRSAT